MSTAVNPLTSASTGQTQSGIPGATSRTDPLASESTFLTLLVSQLQNQDPLSPVDSNQFVTQLTQYSQLEQLIGIHTDTTTLSQAGTTPTTTTTLPTTSASTTSATTTSAMTSAAATTAAGFANKTTTGANN